MERVKKRDRLAVIHDILNIIKNNQNSIKITPLLRNSNLSSTSFNEYYQELIDKKLIKEIETDEGRKYVTLTDKGFNFLEKYNQITSFIEEFNL